MPPATVRLRQVRPPWPGLRTEYGVLWHGRTVGFAGNDGERWLAYDDLHRLLAMCDMDTRYEAVEVVLHPECVGMPPLR